MNTIDGQPELTEAPASSEKKLFSQADESNLTTGYNSEGTSLYYLKLAFCVLEKNLS
jgi:hypothetical protein